MEENTQTERTFKIGNVDQILLLGFNDANLKPIQDRFNVLLTIRGEDVHLKGEVTEIEAVEKIFKEMIFVLNTTGKLKVEDVMTIISLTVTGKEIVSKDRKSTRLNSSHTDISYAVFCLKKKKQHNQV